MKVIKANPKVSLIMGVYNNESTLENCIVSLISQTYSNWELVACDDNSNDNSFEILKKYQKKDPRIKFIKNRYNLGLAATLNKCLHCANGYYVARMDADDFSYRDRLFEQVSFLEENKDYQIVGSNMNVFDGEKVIGIRKSIEKPSIDTFLSGTPFYHPTVMIINSSLKKVGNYNTNVVRCEDVELWFRCFRCGLKGYNIQKPLYRYSESISDYGRRSFLGAISAMVIYIRGYKQVGIPWYKWWHGIKPLISVLLPDKLMNKYHQIRLENSEEQR